jgi:hypothetical protein
MMLLQLGRLYSIRFYEEEEMWKEAAVACFMCLTICLEENEEHNSKYLYHGQDLNSDSFEYKTGALTT